MAEEEKFDRKVRDKFKDEERPVPVGLWENIAQSLPPEAPIANGTSPWVWWIGSIVSIAVVSTLLYFLLPSSENKNSSSKTTSSAKDSSISSSDQNNSVSSIESKRKESASGSPENQDGNATASSSSVQQSSNSSSSNINANTNSENNFSVKGSSVNNNSTRTGRNSSGKSSKDLNSNNENTTTNNTTSSHTRNGGTGSIAGHVTTGTASGVNTNGNAPQNNVTGSITNPTEQNTNTNSTTNLNYPASPNVDAVNGKDLASGVPAPAVSNGENSGSQNLNTGNTAFAITKPGLRNADTSLNVNGTNDPLNTSQNVVGNSDQGNADVSNPVAEIDSTKVNRNNVPVVMPVNNTGQSNNATNTNSSNPSGVAVVNQNSTEMDSTHSISNPAYPEVIMGDAEEVNFAAVTDTSTVQGNAVVDSLSADSVKAKVDSTLQIAQHKTKEKEKLKKQNNNLHPISVEAYVGAGYGAYGLGLNPNAVYADSLQQVLMNDRFTSGSTNNKLNVSLGLRGNFKVSERFEVYLGIRYQQYAQSYSYEAKRLDSIYFSTADSHHLTPLYHYTSFPQSGKEKTTFINIPIGVTYKYPVNDKIALYGRGAFELRFMSSTGWNVKDINGNVYASGKPTSSFNTGVYLGAGVQYKLTDRVLLFAEPNTSFTINNLYSKSALVKQRPASVGVAIGLRMEF